MARSLVLALLFLGCTAVRYPDVPVRDDMPGEAAAHYAKKRTGTNDLHRSYALARAQMRAMERYSTASDAFGRRGAIEKAAAAKPFDRWSFLGPGNVGGRTRALIIDPLTPEVMYAAGVSGGVWKTHNAGERWEPIADDLVNIAVASLAMHPTDTKTLYAGTGEGYFREEQRGTGLPLRGYGIFVTRDAGSTWTHLPSTANEDFHWVNDLVISTHDPSRIYAATRTGVWRSTDGGGQWTRVVQVNAKGGCLDLAYRGDRDGDYLFASCGTFERATVYRTTNAERDAAWTAVLSEPNMGRTSLAIAPSDPSIVYALSASNEAGNFNQGLLAVFRSDENGDAGSWEARIRNTSTDRASTLLLTNPLYGSLTICRSNQARDVFITMGWYCNALAVDPVDPNRVWAGGVDLFRSDDGGASWGVASYWWTTTSRPSFVHADQHAIVFHPDYDANANRKMFVANDGGIYRTDDALADPATGPQAPCNTTSNLRFVPLNNNYGVTQFYHGAVYPDGRTFIAGAQDNGTVRGSIAAGTDGWVRVTGGDGGYVAVDPHDPAFVYAESQGGVLYRSRDGGVVFETATAGLSDDFAFITPFAMDPNDTQRLWYGGTKLWRTDDRADFWRAASATLRGKVSAIAVARGMSDRVLAGTDEGDIVRSDNATTATGTTRWSESRPRNGFVSSLTFDPVDPNVAYATYAGFGGSHVWKSIDGGATWSSLDGALPDIPVHSLVVDPTRRDRLYLGTDLGVFVSLDGGANWAVENTGFTAAVTESLVIGQGARGPAIYAFTHGRGAWRAELTLPGPAPRRRSVR